MTAVVSWIKSAGGWTRRGGVVPPGPLAYDWSDENPPWAGYSENTFLGSLPFTPTVVDLNDSSGDFYTALTNTVNAAGGRVVVRLPAEVLHLNQFRLIGSSGDPKYAKAFWHPNLQGIIGASTAQTIVRMDPDSVTAAQLSAISTMTYGALATPLAMGLWRFDGSPASPTVVAGLTFQGSDQQMLTAVASGNPAVVPQPCPYMGLNFTRQDGYTSTTAYVSHVRFQGAARAMNGQPPYECMNASSQYANIYYTRCEFDGRLAAEVDPARPRRCGPLMGNNEYVHSLTDCWLHHSNISRYAVNDGNAETFGVYSLTRTKLEQITNTRNTDPALNGGDSLGGYENSSLCGWESIGADVNVTDCILSCDNPYTSPGQSCHLQFTTVGSRNPSGGYMTVTGLHARNTGFPHLDGYVTVRAVSPSHWLTDGLNNTMDVRSAVGGNTRLQPYVASSFPPSAATLASAGVTPQTHYIVKTT